MDQELIDNLHKLAGGDDIGSKEDFIKEFLADDELRRNLHKLAGGDSIGSYDEFLKEVGVKIKPTAKPVSKPILQPSKPVVEPENILRSSFNDPKSLLESAAKEKKKRQEAVGEIDDVPNAPPLSEFDKNIQEKRNVKPPVKPIINEDDFEKPQTRFDEVRNAKSISQIRYEQARDDRLKIEKQIEDDKTGVSLEFLAPQYKDAKKREEAALWESQVDPHAIGIAKQFKERKESLLKQYNEESKKDIRGKDVVGPTLSNLFGPSQVYVNETQRDKIEKQVIQEFAPTLSAMDSKSMLVAVKGADFVRKREESINKAKKLFEDDGDYNLHQQVTYRDITPRVDEELRKAVGDDKIWEGIKNWDNYQAEVAFSDVRDLEYEKLIKPYIDQINTKGTKLNKIYRQSIYDVDMNREAKAKANAAAHEFIDMNFEGLKLSNEKAVREAVLDSKKGEIKKIINNDQVWKGWEEWPIYYESTIKAGIGKRNPDYEKMMKPYLEEASNPETPLGKANIEYGKAIEPYNKVQKDLQDLPSKYKRAQVAEAFTANLDSEFEKKYKFNTDFGKGLYNLIATVYGGLERNAIDAPANLAYMALDRLGVDFGTKKLFEAAASDNIPIIGKMSKKFDRPGTEKKATFEKDGKLYTIGFTSDGKLSGYYDSKDDYPVTFMSDPLTEEQKAEYYKKASWDRNWKSYYAQGGKITMDVLGTLGYSKAVSLASKSARTVEFTGGFLQYLPQSVVSDIRSGMPLDEAFAHAATSVGTSMLIEIANPMIGNIAQKGRTIIPSLSKVRSKDVLIAIGKKKINPLQAGWASAKKAVVDAGSEVVEEVTDMPLQVLINRATNNYLNGDIDDVEFPNILDYIDTGIATIAGVAFSAGQGAVGNYQYMRSNDYLDEVRFKTFNPKNGVNKILDKAVDKKILTHEEAAKTKEVALAMEPYYKAFDNLKTKDPRAEIAKQKIIGLASDIEYLRMQTTGNTTFDKDINAKIQKQTLKLNEAQDLLMKLEKNPKSVPANIFEEKPSTKVETEPNIKAYDFDGTLVDNEGNLTELGQEVKQRVENGEKVTVVTAREKNNTKQIEDVFGNNPNLQIEATGDEAKKRDVLNNLGISPDEYFDSDTEKLNAIRGGQVVVDTKKDDPNILTETDLRNNVPIEIDGKKVKSYNIGDNVGGGAGTIEVEFEGREDTGGVISAEEAKSLKNTYIIDENGKIYEVGTEKQVSITKQGAKVDNAEVSDVEIKRAEIEKKRQDALNNLKAENLSVMASDYLLNGGVGAILSSDYFIQGLMGSFTNASSKIAAIRNKYANEVNSKYGNLSDFVGTDLYNKMINEIRDVINSSYSTQEAQSILDEILKYPSGVPTRLGHQLSGRLDDINNTIDKINAKYDAELAALEQEAKKAETETKTEEVTYQAPKSNPLNLYVDNLPTDKNGRISVITQTLESRGEIVYEDENGNPCGRAKKAKFGAKTTKFEPGHKWSIVEVVKGKSHEQGGTDIKL